MPFKYECEINQFSIKKMKKVCDNNLTYAGYGALCVTSSFPT